MGKTKHFLFNDSFSGISFAEIVSNCPFVDRMSRNLNRALLLTFPPSQKITLSYVSFLYFFVLSDHFIFTAGHRTVKHMFPVFGPRLAPAHLASACLAGFAGQVLLVTFKCEFHPGLVVRFFFGLCNGWKSLKLSGSIATTSRDQLHA